MKIDLLLLKGDKDPVTWQKEIISEWSIYARNFKIFRDNNPNVL
jgi:hypothetical protein